MLTIKKLEKISPDNLKGDVLSFWMDLLSSKEKMESFQIDLKTFNLFNYKKRNFFKNMFGVFGTIFFLLGCSLLVFPENENTILVSMVLFLIAAIASDSKMERFKENINFIEFFEKNLEPLNSENQKEIKKMIGWVNEVEACKSYHQNVIKQNREFCMMDYTIMETLKSEVKVNKYQIEELYNINTKQKNELIEKEMELEKLL